MASSIASDCSTLFNDSMSGRVFNILLDTIAMYVHVTAQKSDVPKLTSAELGMAQSILTSSFAPYYGLVALRAMGIVGAPSPTSPIWSPTSVAVSGITNSTIPSFAL